MCIVTEDQCTGSVSYQNTLIRQLVSTWKLEDEDNVEMKQLIKKKLLHPQSPDFNVPIITCLKSQIGFLNENKCM